MNFKVLLVFHSDQDKTTSIEKLPPLGILSLASYLESKGIRVDVLDYTINPGAEIIAEQYNLIGFSINISNRVISLKEIASLKKKFPNKEIVVGGSLCVSNPEIFTDNDYLDAIFTGESEEALYEYITCETKSQVKGIYLRKGSLFEYTGPRPITQDLDSLPFPAFNKVDLTKYNNFPKRNRPLASIFTSRGCPFGCIFCSHSMGKKWRPRSAEKVVEEIKWLTSEFGVKEILIYDDNFSLDRERAEQICDLIIGEKLDVCFQFSNGLRADSLDLQLLEKLKKMGTWLMGLAPEVGNAEVMRKIKKGFSHEKVLQARAICRDVGIKTHGFFMIGFPFENRETIKETVDFAIKLDCEMVEFNKVIPYAKTPLYEMLVEAGDLLNDSVSNVKSYHEGTIITHRVGDLEEDEIKKTIRKAYRKYYLRPKKMIDLLQTFSIQDLFELTLYAVRTRNI